MPQYEARPVACLRHGLQVLLGFGALIAVTANAQMHTYERGEYRFAVGPRPTFVHPREVPTTWNPKAPGATDAHWRNWLVDAQVDRRGGERRRYYDHAWESTTSELLDEAAKFEIGFSPDFENLVLHSVELRRDGRWQDRLDPDKITLARRESEFERDLATGVVSALLVISDVRPGDVVRVSYSVAGVNRILAGFDHDEFGFASGEPILLRAVRILFDRDAQPVAQTFGTLPEATQHRGADALVWEYQARELAGIADEGSYPVGYTPYPRLLVAYPHTWPEVAAWAAALYPRQVDLPPELEAKLVQWRSLKDRDARVMAALRAVQEEVRYFSVTLGASSHRPTAPGETWRRRYGDCKDKAWLLATLLQRMDIEAYPALVATTRGQSILQAPAAASLFDHVIVQVPGAGGTLWLDGTMTQQRGSPRDTIPFEFGAALPVRADATALASIDMPADLHDSMRVAERIEPTVDGSSATWSIQTTYEGRSANEIRRSLATSSREDITKHFADYYRRRYGALEPVGELEVVDTEQNNRIVMREHYLLAEPWTTTAGSVRALDLYAESMDSYLGLPSTLSRAAPLGLVYPISMEQVTELKLPQGWSWLGTPAESEIEDGGFRYLRRLKITGDTIAVRHAYTSSADRVAVADLAEHFKHRRAATDALSVRLSVRLPQRAARVQRDQRLQGLLRELMDKKSDAKPEPQR